MDAAKLQRHLEAIAVRRNGFPVNRQTGRRLRAVLPVHTLGHPVDLDPLLEVCQRFDLRLVEDACEAMGSLYKGRHAGTFGLVAAVSFNGNKIVTTGGGGAVLTADPRAAELARHLSTTAKVARPWISHHDRVGFNYRLPSLNAAIGCAQLERLSRFVELKRRLAARYREAVAHLPGVQVFAEADFARSNYWLCALLFDEGSAGSRNVLLERTRQAGILTRPLWPPLHRLPMFSSSPRTDLSVAESLESRLVCLPSSARHGACRP
jgi:perosamine synthetase